jgi:hypothetical protein
MEAPMIRSPLPKTLTAETCGTVGNWTRIIILVYYDALLIAGSLVSLAPHQADRSDMPPATKIAPAPSNG